MFVPAGGRSGCHGPVNVMDALRAVLPSRPCVRTVTVGNGSLDARVQLPALDRHARRELLDWAQAIALRHTARTASTWLPGAALIHDAWQVYRAASAARRGELLAMAAVLPVAALLPPATASWLAEGVSNLLPAALEHTPEHDQAVLLIAAMALLAGNAAPPSGGMPGPATSRAGTVVRAFRLTMEGLRGVRNLLAVSRAAWGPHRLGIEHLQGTGTQPTRNASIAPLASSPGGRAAERPSALAWPAGVDREPSAARVAGSSWPLPSADAAPRGGKVKPKPARAPAPRMGGSNPAGTGTAPNTVKRRHHHGQRARAKNPLDREEGPTAIRGNPASRTSAAIAGHADAKESMMSPQSYAVAAAGSHDKRATQAPPASPVALVDVLPPGHRSGAHRSAEGAAGGHPLAEVPGMPLLRCIRFDGDARAMTLLIDRQRRMPDPIRFCVSHARLHAFHAFIARAPDQWQGLGSTMETLAVREHTPASLRTAWVETTDGLVSALRHLGKHHVLTLLTLSVPTCLPVHELPVAVEQWLEPGTFRLMDLQEASGAGHTVLAYCVRGSASASTGVKAGFVEINRHASGDVSVEDDLHGMSIVAPTLTALVELLQSLLGLRHAPLHDGAGAPMLRGPAMNLFVGTPPVAGGSAPPIQLAHDPTLEFFGPVRFHAVDESVALYRRSFRQAPHAIFFADQEGRPGTLSFGPHVVNSEARQLRCDTLHEHAFVKSLGLHVGVFYAPSYVAERLDAHGLVSLPGQLRGTASMAAHGGVDCASPRPFLSSAPEGDAPATPAPAHWDLQSGVLYYREQDGYRGTITLEVVQGPQPRYRLPASDDPLLALFARRYQLQPSLAYTAEELSEALEAAGFRRLKVRKAKLPLHEDPNAASASRGEGAP